MKSISKKNSGKYFPRNSGKTKPYKNWLRIVRVVIANRKTYVVGI